jgi:hypothetical protein
MWFSASTNAQERAASCLSRRRENRRASRQRALSPSLLQLEARRLLSVSLLGGIPGWNEQGPEPIVGYVQNATPPTSVGAIESAVVEPTTSGYIVYAGTVNGGIWRSDNITSGMFNGTADPTSAAWRPLSDNEPSLSTSSMALDPNDPTGNTLWVGTGSLSSFGNDGGPGIGLLKTSDGGNTWSVLGNDLPHVPIVRMLPTNLTDTGSGPGHGGQIVLVATAQDGIYWSGDGGQTFSNVFPGDATDLVADPNTPGTFYAASPGQGLFVSNDNGQDWAYLVATTGDMLTSRNMRLAVTTDPSTGDTILWVATTQTVYRSPVLSNGFISFTSVGPSPYDPVDKSDALQALSITADPTDPNTAYVAKFGALLLRFTYAPGTPNNGSAALLDSIYLNDLAAFTKNPQYASDYNSLDPVTQSFPHGDFRSLTFLNSTTLLETDDGGIYGVNNPQNTPPIQFADGESVVQLSAPGWVSLAGGNSSTFSPGIRDTEFFSVAYDPLNGLILGGNQDNGTALQGPGPSAVWNSILGGDGGTSAADPTTVYTAVFPPRTFPDTTLYMFGNGVFFKSFEGFGPYPVPLQAPGSFIPYSGLNLADAQTMSTNGTYSVSYPFILNTLSGITDPEPLLLGMTGIYESFDGGNTVANLSPPGMTGNVKGLAYGSSNSGLAAYFTTDTGQIWVRNNPGQTFAFVPPPSWGFDVYARKIVMDPDDYHNAYVLDSNNNVWQLQLIDNGQNTTNGGTVGAVWQNITDNLRTVANDQGNIDLRSLEIYDPTPGSTPGDGIPLVGGLGGVYRRLPTGLGAYFWSKFGQNSNEVLGASFPNVLVTDLHYISPNPVNPAYGDILLAGTFGRGAWIVEQAGASLSQPSTLLIEADPGGPNQIRLVMDPAITNPPTLDVFQNNTSSTPNYQIPLAFFNLIQVNSVGIPTTLTVDESNGLISSELEFLGGSGNDTLVIQDHQDPTAENVTLGTDQISGLGPGILYTNVNYVRLIGSNQPAQSYTLANTDPVAQTELDTGAGGNFVYVQQTAGAVTINSGGYDYITVHDPNGLQDIRGALAVNGFLDETTLVLDDRGDSSYLTFTLTDAAITNLAPATITYNTVGNLDIITGQGNDEAQVQNTAAPLIVGRFILGTTTTDISNGGTGNLVAFVTGTQSELIVAGAFLVEVGNGTVQGIQGEVLALAAGSASVALLVDDATDPQAEHAVLGKLNSSTYGITGLAPAPIAFGSGVGLTEYFFGPGGTFTVDNTPAGANITIESSGTVNVLGNAGNLEVDFGTVNVGGIGNGLDAIQGPITIYAAATLDYLDQGTTPGQTLSYTVSANQLSRTGTATVTYTGVATVNINAANAASAGFNTIYIETTASGTSYSVYGGSSGVTEFAVSNNSSLDGIQGTLKLHGQPAPPANDFALVSDFLNPVVHTYTLSTGEFQRDGMSPIFYDGLTVWEVFTGQRADAVNVLSVGTGVSTVVAAPSADTVTVGTPTGGGHHTLQNILDSLLVSPTSSQQPTILIDDSGNPSTAARTVTFDNKNPYGYRIHNLAPGDLYVRPGTGSPITIKGDGGNETFAFQDLPPNMQMALDGGGGTNTLDYSQYVGDVTVDLPLGIATGLTGGISNIQNVTGSQGNDLLVGDANANVLTGGTGRNVVIGGTGPDTLDASGASSDNILIGGTTDFDTNLAALDAIFAEWTRTDLGFKDRFSDLTSGSNGEGKTPLNQVSGQLILLTPKTVHADSSPDTLIGTNQTDPATGKRAHNWFFYDSDDTIVNYLSSSDHKTKVK